MLRMLWLNTALIEGSCGIHTFNPEATAVIWMDIERDIQLWCSNSRVPSASAGTSSQPLSSIRSAHRFGVLRDVFTSAVSSREPSRTFNKIACKGSGGKMMETPADGACHCGLPAFNFNA